MKQDKTFLFLTLLAGLLLRLDFLVAGDFVIDSDEAIVGLMARHILEGQPVPVFYYGQHYMGSFEPLLTTLVFAVLGPSLFGLKLVPLLFSLLFIILVYLIGCELYDRRAGRYAALIAALPPATLVVWSAKARGGFIELVCIGAIALLLTIRALKKGNHSMRSVGVIGLVLGFGWWVNNQIIFFMLPIGAVFLLHFLGGSTGAVHSLIRTGKALSVGLVAFLIGGLPYWLYNLRNDFVSFDMFGSSSGSDLLEQVTELFSKALPIILGAKRFWQVQDVFAGASTVIGVLMLLMLLLVVYFRISEGRERKRVAPGVELLLLFIFSTLSVFAVSSFGYLSQAPRYLLPLYAGIFPLVGYGLSRLYERTRLVSVMLCVAVIGVHLASSYYGRRALPGEPFVYKGQRVSKDHGELIEWLREHDIKWVKTNYWIGYRLAFETNEQVRFLLFQKPHQERIQSYREEGQKQDVSKIPYILVPHQAALVTHGLKALGYTFEADQVSGYTVIHKIQPLYDDVVPLELSPNAIVANFRAAAGRYAIDGDRETRWGSGQAQNNRMKLDLLLNGDTTVRAIRYDMGRWIHDYPRGLKIEIQERGAPPRTLLNENDFKAIRYLVEYDPSWMMFFQPVQPEKISFQQVSSHPVFDWSVAELTVYR